MFSQDKSIGWILVGIIALEIIITFLISTPESARQVREAEQGYTKAILGETRALRAKGFAENYFKAHWVETGIVNELGRLVPTDEARSRATGMEDLLPGLFGWVQKRLEGFWPMVYGAYHRLYVMLFVLLFGIPVLLPALIDGLVERKIAIETNDVAKPVFFHGAKKLLGVMVVMPLVILFLPTTVNATIWFAWLIVLPMVIWVTAKNVQEL
jgi:hypothetical protein